MNLRAPIGWCGVGMVMILILVVTGAPAQNGQDRSRFLAGFTAGVSITSGHYKYSDGPEPPSFNPLISAGGGITLDWRISKGFSLQNTFLYRAKGDKISMESWATKFREQMAPVSDPAFTLDAEGFVKTDLRYLEWTLCPNLVLGRRVELGMGLFAAVGLAGKQTEDYWIHYYWEAERFRTREVFNERKADFVNFFQLDEDSLSLPVNRLDYGLAGRMGLRLGSFSVAASIHYSLNHWEPIINNLFYTLDPLNETQHISAFISLTWYLMNKRNS